MFSISIFLCFFFTVQAQWGNGNSGCQTPTPDKQSGICLPIATCKTMSDFLAKVTRPPPPEIKKKLKEFQCGVVGNKPKICCPSNPINLDERSEDDIPSVPDANSNIPDISAHRNINLLPKNCGHLDTVDKIVNGNKTGLFEFPWMALLSYQTSRGPDFRCGGTILNEKYILTAAHCVTNLEKTREKLKLIGVRVGDHNIRTMQDCEEEEEDEGEPICAPPYQDLQIEQVISHKTYSGQTHINDIALLRVSRINLALENSRPVCLPLGENRNVNLTSRNVVVTGWGATEKGASSPDLLKVELPIISRQECQVKYEKLYKLIETQICAGGVSKSDSCGGDSGGPLHALGVLFDEPRFIQQGIVSFGPQDCGRVPLPGVYTRVAAFMDWILDNMKP